MLQRLLLLIVLITLSAMPTLAQDESPIDCNFYDALIEANELLDQAETAEPDEVLALLAKAEDVLIKARFECVPEKTIPPLLVRESTRTNPIPLGFSGLYGNQGRMWIIDFKRDGEEVIIHIGFSCEVSPDETCAPEYFRVSLMGESGKIYNYDRDQDTSPQPRLKAQPEMYGIGEAVFMSGYIGFIVDEDEGNLVFSADSRDAFFALD